MNVSFWKWELVYRLLTKNRQWPPDVYPQHQTLFICESESFKANSLFSLNKQWEVFTTNQTWRVVWVTYAKIIKTYFHFYKTRSNVNKLMGNCELPSSILSINTFLKTYKTIKTICLLYSAASKLYSPPEFYFFFFRLAISSYFCRRFGVKY